MTATQTRPTPTEARRVENDPIDAIARLPENLAIMKMENDQMFSVAKATPRNHADILKRMKEQLTTYKSMAEEAMYCKPCGKDPETGVMKYARGLSVRSAETLAELYGFNKTTVTTEPLDDDHARISSQFIDYQQCRQHVQSTVKSRVYKTRSGALQRTPEDRFYDLVCKAEGSRLLRECILRCMPAGLKADLEVSVNEILDTFLDENTVKKLIASYASKNVGKEAIEQYLGKRVENLNKEDRRNLLQMWNAIEGGDTTVDEIFGANGAGNGGTKRVPVETNIACPPGFWELRKTNAAKATELLKSAVPAEWKSDELIVDRGKGGKQVIFRMVTEKVAAPAAAPEPEAKKDPVADVVEHFKPFGVTLEDLQAYLDKPGEFWEQPDYEVLSNVYRELQSGAKQAAEYFPRLQATATPTIAPEIVKLQNDLLELTGKVQDANVVTAMLKSHGIPDIRQCTDAAVLGASITEFKEIVKGPATSGPLFGK